MGDISLYTLYSTIPDDEARRGDDVYQKDQLFLSEMALVGPEEIPANRFVDMDPSIAIANGIDQEHVTGAPSLYPFDWEWAIENQIKSKLAKPLGPQH